jgi:hypothetical protein
MFFYMSSRPHNERGRFQESGFSYKTLFSSYPLLLIEIPLERKKQTQKDAFGLGVPSMHQLSNRHKPSFHGRVHFQARFI